MFRAWGKRRRKSHLCPHCNDDTHPQMKKVFFGGSRKLGKLNKELCERIDKVIDQNFLVLVGDANRADRAFQQYLTERPYANVLVFCAGDVGRTNPGGWETR